MTDRVRILLHEANDIDELLRDYIIESIAPCWDKESEENKQAMVHAYDDTHHTNHARIEELLNRLGEVYETALARNGRYVDAEP